jgi:hypothetical protein
MKPIDTVYRGKYLDPKRYANPWYVTVGSKKLDIGPSQSIRNHSEEFAWGYGGSGPSQLALAILYDFTERRKFSEMAAVYFKEHFIVGLPNDVGSKWEITGDAIATWLNLFSPNL